MDSFIQTRQQSDYSQEPRILNQLNKHRFYVFFDREKFQYDNLFHNMQKMSFKIKQQRYSHSDKYIADSNKSIQLSYHDLTDQSETHSGLIQLKNQAHDCKVRIIVYAKQSILIRLLQYARTLNVKIQTVPIIVYSSGLNNDLSRFLGWGQNKLDGSMKDLQCSVKKWICSLNEKIDSWNVYIKVHEDTGQIYRFNKQRNEEIMEQNKQIIQGFFSNVSVGTHPRLARDFSQGRENQTGFFSNFMYKLQSYKKFCCVGQPNMRTATGVVNARFTDENGDEHQILKQFHNEDNLDERQKKLYKHRRRILSIVVSNIDYYHGRKINNYQPFKTNDNKLQLLTFQSEKQSQKIASIAGQIKLNLESQKSVYVQVNDVCFRLVNPSSLIIKQSEKYRMSINKQILET